MSTAFTAGEQHWHARLGKLRDVVRQEVVARQLDRELPPAPADDAEPPPDLHTLLACEERAGRTDPYRQVAALLHLIARSRS